MRNLLIASAAISALALGAAQAQESVTTPPNAPAAERATDTPNAADSTTTQSTEAEAGAAAGIATGAIAGAVVGGPVGAVIGGFAGAVLGSAAAVPDPAVEYVVANPTPPVVLEGGVSEGMVIQESAQLTPIPDYPDYGYVYADGRPVIVRMTDRQVVYSPGFIVPEQTVTYVRENPRDPVVIDGGVTVGAVLPQDVQLVEIPSDPAYSYVYTDAGPVLVNRGSRTVVWVQGS